MTYRASADAFEIEYIESEIRHSVLWERHCHSRYEMIAVVDGDVTVMLEGQIYRLQGNQILVIPPLFYHSVAANGTGSYRRITALFGVDAIPEELRDSFAKQGRSASPSLVSLEKMRKTCQRNLDGFYSPLLQSMMIELLYDMLQGPAEPSAAPTDDFLQRALSYIDAHLQEKISLDDLAKATNRSKSSFCHRFEEKMKISPKQYILQKKLALASKLIDEGMPRTMAAMQIGYDNYSNFYRLYMKH